MTPRPRLAAVSRDAHLTLRRVERQQWLIERLYASRTTVTFAALARELDVSERTIARDIQRLRESGVPVRVTPGRGGGVTIDHRRPAAPVPLDLPEVAALIASLAAVGPTVSESAASAMHKLAQALHHDP